MRRYRAATVPHITAAAVPAMSDWHMHIAAGSAVSVRPRPIGAVPARTFSNVCGLWSLCDFSFLG